jgi:hypothetical protein
MEMAAAFFAGGFAEQHAGFRVALVGWRRFCTRQRASTAPLRLDVSPRRPLRSRRRSLKSGFKIGERSKRRGPLDGSLSLVKSSLPASCTSYCRSSISSYAGEVPRRGAAARGRGPLRWLRLCRTGVHRADTLDIPTCVGTYRAGSPALSGDVPDDGEDHPGYTAGHVIRSRVRPVVAVDH